MMRAMTRRRTGFSLTELILMIVILGILAAMAIPQLSRGATVSSAEQLDHDLALLRIAIEMYFDQHGEYPGARDAGEGFGGAGTPEAFAQQLTMFSAQDGRVSRQPSETFCFGPYLKDGIPACCVADGTRPRCVWLCTDEDAPGFQPDAADYGWVFNYRTGYIAANSDRLDEHGARFDTH